MFVYVEDCVIFCYHDTTESFKFLFFKQVSRLNSHFNSIHSKMKLDVGYLCRDTYALCTQFGTKFIHTYEYNMERSLVH